MLTHLQTPFIASREFSHRIHSQYGNDTVSMRCMILTVLRDCQFKICKNSLKPLQCSNSLLKNDTKERLKARGYNNYCIL